MRRINRNDLLSANWVNTVTWRHRPRGGAAVAHALSIRSAVASRLQLSIGCGKRDSAPPTNDGCKWPTSTYIGARPGIYLTRYPGVPASVSVFTSSTLTPALRRRKGFGPASFTRAASRWKREVLADMSSTVTPTGTMDDKHPRRRWRAISPRWLITPWRDKTAANRTCHIAPSKQAGARR